MDVLRKDASRITAENNKLHIELIQANEKIELLERDHYHQLKKLEDQIEELAYWKSQTVDKVRNLENTNDGLKLKLQTMLITGERCGFISKFFVCCYGMLCHKQWITRYTLGQLLCA